VPRNTRKKFQKFLSSRRSHAKKVRVERSPSSYPWFEVLCALLPPALIAVAYGALHYFRLFSLLYPPLHMAAFVALFVWAVLAFRGTKGYWTYKIDAFFGLVVLALLGFGACWGGFGALPVKAWISAPPYARQASVQLDGPARGKVHQVLEGSLIHISWQSEEKAPTVLFAGREDELEATAGSDFATSLTVPALGRGASYDLLLRRGWHRIGLWSFGVTPDETPKVSMTEEPEITARKTIRFAYKAMDDYGIEQIGVRIAPTASSTGLSTEPVEIVLASPSVKELETASYTDLTSLPWAGVPVTIQLVVTDGAGHRGWSEPKILTLPTRAFHNPFARALIEERQKFMAQPDRVIRDETANVMAGIARQQSLYHGDPVVMMALRAGAVRLVLNEDADTVGAVGDTMWKAAVRLEEGVLGQVRLDLANAERDLSFALLREASVEDTRPYLGLVHKAMWKYFDALEAERARQPPALQEMDWPLATASEMLTPEDLQGRLSAIGEQLAAGERGSAQVSLAQLQALIENLRTTPPELTPAQAQIAQHVAALRALVRGQKNLIDEVARVSLDKNSPEKAKKAAKDLLSRTLTQQQLLISALRDITGRQGLFLAEAKDSETAMQKASAALQQKALAEVHRNQAEALTLLQNCLTTLTEQMRRSMTAKAP